MINPATIAPFPKLLLVDINGTITRSRDGSPFTPESDPTAIELLPGVTEALDRYQAMGAAIVGVSNQGGIAAGKRTFSSVIAEMEHTLRLAPQLECVLLCPDFGGRECWDVSRFYPIDEMHRSTFWRVRRDRGETANFRKPVPSMLIEAMRRESIRYKDYDRASVLMVGDRPEDFQAAEAAGVAFQWADKWRAGK